MPYIVDTYNCIHAGLNLGGAFSNLTVHCLCQWIAASPRNPKVLLVLDGGKKPDEPDETEFTSINFRYSGPGISADSIIAQLVERSQSRKKLIVVSNDRAVMLHARKNYASAMTCEAFLTELLGAQPTRGGKNPTLPAQKTGGPSTRGETDHWLKEFGINAPPPLSKPPARNPDDEIDNLDMDQLMGNDP